MSLHLTVLLLAAVGVLANTQSGNSQAAIDHDSKGQSSTTSFLTAPAELVPVSAENLRFSRLLKDSANVLQFSSISNDAPPIWGLAQDGKKQAKNVKLARKNAVTDTNFGRRALDYDEQIHALEESTSESKIIANPYPGNEYVFVHPGKLIQAPVDSDVAASVTSINNKPPRVPLALLRQKKGKRVNISPLFTEVPQIHHDTTDAKEFVWVDQPAEHHHRLLVSVNRQGRKHEDEDESTTNPAFQEEDLIEATTLADDIPIETTTAKQNNKSKLIVNVVTSAPRFSVESSVGEKKTKRPRVRTTSGTTSTTTSASTTSEATTEASTSTTTFATTSQAPTTVAPVVLSSSSPRAVSADDKENLVTDAFHRSGSTFHGFEDTQTKLQTAESSQPARVNVRPAQNGKEYEYEYIYYYYDDDNENGGEGGEKRGEGKGKGGEPAKDLKSASHSSSASSTTAVGSDAPSSTTVTISSSSTTSTTTLAPELTSDADFEYEDDAILEEEIKVSSKAPELQKTTPTATRTVEEPIHKAVSSAEKLSNSNPINQLDRSRGPKQQLLPGKFDESVADYKLETEASQEDEVVSSRALSRGQPQFQEKTSSEEDEQTVDSPVPVTQVNFASTNAPGSTSGLDIEHMSTLAKNHRDSVNVPIVLKQSTLLKAVPVSQLQPHQIQLPEERPSTAPFTTPTTTATTIEAASEAVPSVRPSPPRLRGHRLRGSVTPRPSTTTTQGVTSEQPAEEKQTVRRPHLRDSSRRVPSRRPAQETAEASEQQPSASPIIETHARPLPIRPRFPPRTAGHATSTAASPVEVSDAPVIAAVTVSAAELNSLDDKKAKDAHVRSKSANDLFAFARLQQAISSRAPSRIQPKLVAGFVNSAEVTTDAITSSEVTTVSSFNGQSAESLGAVSVEPTPTSTTTTTTEAVQQDKFGRQRGNPRFGGRTRKPIGGTGGAGSSTTTEAPATTRGRFSGSRRRTSTTEGTAGAEAPTSAAVTNNSEAPKARVPSRNRFASRNRVSTTEATVTAEQQKTVDSEKPASTQPRRRPGTSFQGRRRPNQIQGQTEAPTTQEETASTSADSSSTAAVASTVAPVQSTPGRNRFNFAGAGGRPRAAAATAPGSNPVRIRGGGRLRGPTTSTTTESVAVEINEEVAAQEQPADAEQSQSIQTENLEQPIQSAPESVVPQRGGGVLGRLKSRPKLVVTTTTVAPDAAGGDRKPSRLNGILNRRKNLGQLNGAVHVKEEVRESTSEVAEEANNHAQEQEDDHKGVVVQISSSVTESEEVNEAHAGEVVEPATTPGSILNRLKSQRKPGSLFRKKPDPHGE